MIELPDELIDKSGDCWVWLGGTNGDGYGYYKQKRVNRIVLEKKLGRKVTGLALHSCGNRCCCRPDHIREGTHLDNMEDMKKHKTADGKNRKGEKHPLSKLTDHQREVIRNSAAKGVELSRKYGISQSAVSMIRSGVRG